LTLNACFAAAIAWCSGCGNSSSGTAHLQGTVTIGGQAIPTDATGQISFTPTGKGQKPAATAAIVNGKYDCENVPTGPVRVNFTITHPNGPEYTTDRGVTARPIENLVPAKFSAGIEETISGDDAAKNYDLSE
jgi:hypothetical protein